MQCPEEPDQLLKSSVKCVIPPLLHLSDIPDLSYQKKKKQFKPYNTLLFQYDKATYYKIQTERQSQFVEELHYLNRSNHFMYTCLSFDFLCVYFEQLYNKSIINHL